MYIVGCVATPLFSQIDQDVILKALSAKGYIIDSTDRTNSFYATEPSGMYDDDLPLTFNLTFTKVRNTKRIWIYLFVSRLPKANVNATELMQLLKGNGGLACARYMVFEGDTSENVYLAQSIEEPCFETNLIPQVISCMKQEAQRFLRSATDGLAPARSNRDTEGMIVPDEPKNIRSRRR
jgi:hypothetical protein